MKHVFQTQKKTDESFRFRDIDEGYWGKDRLNSNRPCWKEHKKGIARAYWEQRARIYGLDFTIQRPAEGPDAINVVEFEALADRIWDNIVRVANGISIDRDIFSD